MVDHSRVNEVKQATIGLLDRLWQENFAANRPVIERGLHVAPLFDRFRNVPAVVVAAGPSLEKNRALLSSIGNRAMVFAVDTIYRSLVEQGVTPTMAVSLDPQIEIAPHYDGIPTAKRLLLAPTILHPAVRELWQGEIVWYHKFAPDIPTLAAISRSMPQVGNLVPGGSVMSVGLDLAFRMGCDPIAFIGQDLSYPPSGPAYAGDTLYGDIDGEAILAAKPDAALTATDIFGREVRTQKNMMVTRDWMQWAFVNFKRPTPCRFFNCTEGGVVTKNCQIVPFAEWIARFCGPERNHEWEIRKALTRKKR